MTEGVALQRISAAATRNDEPVGAAAAQPAVAQIRAWAQASGLSVADRGKLRPEIWSAWHAANPGR